jgi:hypothetical protein
MTCGSRFHTSLCELDGSTAHDRSDSGQGQAGRRVQCPSQGAVRCHGRRAIPAAGSRRPRMLIMSHFLQRLRTSLLVTFSHEATAFAKAAGDALHLNCALYVGLPEVDSQVSLHGGLMPQLTTGGVACRIEPKSGLLRHLGCRVRAPATEVGSGIGRVLGLFGAGCSAPKQFDRASWLHRHSSGVAPVWFVLAICRAATSARRTGTEWHC